MPTPAIIPTPAEILAATINGREYRSETTKEDRAFAKDHGLVIVYGASDDLCEFEGAFRDEFGGGGTFRYCKTEFVPVEDGDGIPDGAFWIRQTWCPKGRDISWAFETNIPSVHRFTIMEDGEPFSDGLVFRLDDCRPTHCEACEQKAVQS